MKMFALQKKVCASEKCWCKSKKVHVSQKMLAQTKKICASQKIFAQTKKVRTSQNMFAQTTKCSSLQILAFSRNVGASRNMQRIPLFRRCCVPLFRWLCFPVCLAKSHSNWLLLCSAPAGCSPPLKVLLVPLPPEILLIPHPIAKYGTGPATEPGFIHIGEEFPYRPALFVTFG